MKTSIEIVMKRTEGMSLPPLPKPTPYEMTKYLEDEEIEAMVEEAKALSEPPDDSKWDKRRIAKTLEEFMLAERRYGVER